MTSTRAVLKKLAEAVQNYAEERMFNDDDDHAMGRAALRVDRALIEAHRHLDATAPRRSAVLGVCNSEPKP